MTRCPGCSTPITIAGPARFEVPAKARTEDQPRPTRRQREDDDESRRPSLDWTPVERSFGREQLALIFVLVSIVGDLFAACMSSMTGPSDLDGLVVVVTIIVGLLPTIVAAVFALRARLAAISAPRETLARGSAVASLLCCLAGLVCLSGLALALLASLDIGRPSELAVTVTVAGTLIAGGCAVGTFMAFTAQIGIYRKSAALSRGISSIAVAATIGALALTAIGILYTLANGSWGNGSRDDGPFYRAMVLFLMPIEIGIVLIMYHRLLAAGRRSIRGDMLGR